MGHRIGVNFILRDKTLSFSFKDTDDFIDRTGNSLMCELPEKQDLKQAWMLEVNRNLLKQIQPVSMIFLA